MVHKAPALSGGRKAAGIWVRAMVPGRDYGRERGEPAAPPLHGPGAEDGADRGAVGVAWRPATAAHRTLSSTRRTTSSVVMRSTSITTSASR